MMDDALLFRPCHAADIDAICELESETLQHLARPDMLRSNGRQRFEVCLKAPHFTLGAFDGDRLVAVAILYDPLHDEAEDLSHWVGLEWMRSANYKLCIVDARYRGDHLQVRMGQRLEQEALQRGIELLCATVSPMNEASKHNLEPLGYIQGAMVTKYGYDRWVYYKRLRKTDD